MLKVCRAELRSLQSPTNNFQIEPGNLQFRCEHLVESINLQQVPNQTCLLAKFVVKRSQQTKSVSKCTRRTSPRLVHLDYLNLGHTQSCICLQGSLKTGKMLRRMQRSRKRLIHAMSRLVSQFRIASRKHLAQGGSNRWRVDKRCQKWSIRAVYRLVEGSLEVKLPTIWTDRKAEVGRVREEGEEERRSEKRKSQRKEDAGARKGKKVAIRCVFPMIGGSGGSKSRLAKAAGAEPSGQMRDEKLHAGAKHISKSKSVKTWRSRTTFRSWDVEKLHAVVARSTFPCQNVKTPYARTTFKRFRCGFAWQAQGIAHLAKSEQNIGFSMVF